MKFIVSILLGLFTIYGYGCALKQDFFSLENRLVVLEKQNLTLKKELSQIQTQVADLNQSDKKKEQKFNEKEQRFKNKSAKLHAVLEDLTDEIQLLNGKFEEIDYLLKQKIKFFEDINTKEKNRLNLLECMSNQLDGKSN